MSEIKPVHRIADDAIEIRFPLAKQGLLSKFMAKPSARSFTDSRLKIGTCCFPSATCGPGATSIRMR